MADGYGNYRFPNWVSSGPGFANIAEPFIVDKIGEEDRLPEACAVENNVFSYQSCLAKRQSRNVGDSAFLRITTRGNAPANRVIFFDHDGSKGRQTTAI